MFVALAHLVARIPRLVIGVWLVLATVCYALALGAFGQASLFDRLTTNVPADPTSGSYRANQILAEAATAGPTITALVTGVDVAAASQAVTGLGQELASLPGVASVVQPFMFDGTPQAAAARPLLAQDGQGFVMVVELAKADSAELATAVQTVTTKLNTITSLLGGQVLVGGTPLITAAITSQVGHDLGIGQLIALPAALVVMVIFFAGFLAAGVPLLGALISLAGGLGALWVTSYLFNLDASLVNIVFVLGLALASEYGLLLVCRQREELRARVTAGQSRRRRRGDRQVLQSLVATLSNTGPAVVFSAVMVGVPLVGLGLFRLPVLRTFALAAAAMVLIAVLTTLTVVPAVLVLAGRSLVRAAPTKPAAATRWLRAGRRPVSAAGALPALTRAVQTHPWLVLGATSLILVILASPLAGLRVKHTGIDLLPASNSQREFVSTLAQQYPAALAAPIVVVAQTRLEDATVWAEKIAALEKVASVDAATTVGNHVAIGVRVSAADDPPATEAAVVRLIRSERPGFTFFVTGEAAQLADLSASLAASAPLAVGLVLLASGFLLFLLTGSVFLAGQAIITTVATLAAALGVLVWGFQHAHLGSLLGFTATGAIYLTVIVVAAALIFGLSMGQQVFLLTRIKKLKDSGYQTDEAVTAGLQQCGRVLTAAAVVIIVVCAGFIGADLLVSKQVGFVLAVAVLLDATAIRLLLVPAAMKLAGERTWWAPAPARRLRQRLVRS